ncbi:hypothetical protein KKH82_05210 [Patescibacteria group bacterium]|nr:hypothetical protein [Patescibacteria group bacterium]
MLSAARYHNIVKYGPDVHGRRNKLIKNPMMNAHIGEAILDIIFCILGLQANGTSITNHFPYRKKSLRLANHTNIQKTHTIIFKTKVLVAVANALNSHNPIAK